MRQLSQLAAGVVGKGLSRPAIARSVMVGQRGAGPQPILLLADLPLRQINYDGQITF